MQKILVTGCLTQRYQQEILTELPEVDGIMGTGSYGEIVPALAELMAGGRPCRFADIHGMIDEFDRVLTTPGHYAYLRIAEGCDNRCAYCVIPSLRGRYRSRRMEDVLAEARKLSDAGVRECSQDGGERPVTPSSPFVEILQIISLYFYVSDKRIISCRTRNRQALYFVPAGFLRSISSNVRFKNLPF